MKHARSDYNRIQDPMGIIPHDEPVFLLRAQDKFAVTAVRHYAAEIAADPLAPTESQEISRRAREWADTMEDYARQHGKYPDMPAGA